MAVDTFPLIQDQSVLAAKIETTTGTAIALTGTDAAFNIYNAEMTDETELPRRQGQGVSSSITAIPGGYKGRCKFETDLVGGTAGAVPGWATTFLPACGMVQSSGQVFKFVTGAVNAVTLTIGLYEDGLVRKLAGAVGTFTIDMKAGEQGRVKFEFIGKYQVEADTAILTPTYPTVLPPRWANGTATWGSYALMLSTASIDAKNSLVMREDPNATDATGYRSGVVAHREPMVTMDPEAVLVATQAWLTALRASTEAALTFTVGTTGNQVSIAAPKAQVAKRTRGNRDKLLTEQIDMYLNRSTSAGDDELSITFA